jgi:hypothetical protein
MTDKEALIERLATTCHGLDPVDPLRLLVDDVVAALAQPEQEPVAWMWDVNNGGGYTSRGVGLYQTDIPFAKHTPLYTTPPQRTGVGLTDKVITKVVDSMPRGIKGWMSDWDLYEFAKAIEAKLKQKNGFAEEKNT